MGALIPKFKMLTVKDLELDLGNPRISRWMKMYKEPPTAEQISLALRGPSQQIDSEDRAGPSFYSLKQSIQTNEGVIHPIIVNKNKIGKLIVIEGNTRTQIYREFKEKEIPGDWDHIPAMVYENMSKSQVDTIRLQAHLVGTREWDPYSKAKYLTELRNEQLLPFGALIDFCGGKKAEIENMIQAYEDMEKYYRKVVEDNDERFDHTRFSSFVELNKPNILGALAEHGFTKTDFSRWVFERKFPRQELVRKLPIILKQEKLKTKFLKEDAAEALKLIDIPESDKLLKDVSIEQLSMELQRRLSRIEWGYVEQLRAEPDSPERETFFDIRDSLIGFCKAISPED